MIRVRGRPAKVSLQAALVCLNNASMLLSLAASAATVATATAAAAPRPHIIFVMIDDLVRARAATFVSGSRHAAPATRAG